MKTTANDDNRLRTSQSQTSNSIRPTVLIIHHSKNTYDTLSTMTMRLSVITGLFTFCCFIHYGLAFVVHHHQQKLTIKPAFAVASVTRPLYMGMAQVRMNSCVYIQQVTSSQLRLSSSVARALFAETRNLVNAC
jgi:hypothetical protein